MNSTEFKKVLDKFNIHSIIGSKIDEHGQSYEDIYSWKEINIYFGGLGSYYAIVEGCVPYEVARILFKKYPNYRNDVRINGTYNYGRVKDKKFYPKDEMGNSYIIFYHINSIEGLIYLLSELKYFYEVRTYTEETRKALYREQREIISSIYRELIEKGNPFYTVEEWKKEHSISIEEEYDEVTTLVKKFDETVNPYINQEVEVKDPSEFIDKVNISLPYENSKTFLLKMDVEGEGVEYFQSTKKNYLEYIFNYYEDIKHCYVMTIDHIITEKFEEIRFYSYKRNLDLHYDMKSGLVYSSHSEERHPITEEEKQFFIDELNKALKVGKKIIINRMTKKKNSLVKKLK